MKLMETHLQDGETITQTEIQFSSFAEFEKDVNKTLIMSLASKIIEDYDIRFDVCDIILEEDYQLKKVKAKDLLRYFVDENQELPSINGLDDHIDLITIVSDLMLFCNVDREKDEDWAVLVTFGRDFGSSKIVIKKI
jgi:hypothetical protein